MDELTQIIKAYEDNGYRVDVRPRHPWDGPSGPCEVSLVYPAAHYGSATRVAFGMIVESEADVSVALAALAIKIDRMRASRLAASIDAAIATSADKRREYALRELSRTLIEGKDEERRWRS